MYLLNYKIIIMHALHSPLRLHFSFDTPFELGLRTDKMLCTKEFETTIDVKASVGAKYLCLYLLNSTDTLQSEYIQCTHNF